MRPVSFNMEILTDLQDIALSDRTNTLPISFFHSDTEADIFINCHNSVMNNFIYAHDFFEMIYMCKGDILNWVDDRKDFVINVMLPPETFRRTFHSTMHQNRQSDELFHNFALSPDSRANYMTFHNT